MKWFQKLQQLFDAHKQNLVLQAEIISLNLELKKLQTLSGDPRAVVEKIFGRPIKWFDYTELPPEKKKNYYVQARTILDSDVFTNTINYLIATQCQEHVKQYNPITKLDVARDVQMHINAWELLKEELDKIPDPDKVVDPLADEDDLAYKFAHNLE